MNRPTGHPGDLQQSCGKYRQN